MAKILIPIDDSENAMRAVDYVIQRVGEFRAAPEVHLINVQYPMHGGVTRFIDPAQIREIHQEEGQKVLAAAKAKLDAAGLAHQDHIFVGEPAAVVARHATDHHFDEIVMGTRGQNRLGTMLLGSVSTKLLDLTKVPVTLIK